MRTCDIQPWYSVDNLDSETKPVYTVFYGQFQRGVDIALFNITPDMQVAVIIAPVCKPVD